MVLAVMLVFVLTFAGAAMLLTAESDSKATADSQDRIQSLLLADMGVGIAFTEINLERDLSGDGKIGTASQQLTPIQGYTTVVEQKDGIYKVFSVGTVKNNSPMGPREKSNSRHETQRGVEVCCRRTSQRGTFGKAAFGDAIVDGNGGLVTDSYDSRGILQRDSNGNIMYDPSGAPIFIPATYQQQVAAAKAVEGFAAGSLDSYRRSIDGSQGNVGSNANIALGNNSAIFGNATPGYSPTGQYSVSNYTNVYGNHSPAIAHVDLAAPVIPDVTAVPLTGDGPNSGTLDGGIYHFSTWKQPNGTVTIPDNAHVMVVVDQDVDWKGTIKTGPGATLSVFVKSGSVTLNGGGDSSTQYTNSFDLVSAGTGAVKFNGNSTFYGTLYAPYADITGNGSTEIYGAVSGKSLKLTGGATIHYDMNATSPGIRTSLIVVSRREIDM